MDEAIHTEQYKGYTIEIYWDSDPPNPREWSNLGTMWCWLRRHRLGDEEGKPDWPYDQTWDEMEDWIWKHKAPAVVLPVYIYEHGGIALSTGAFHDPWDSGQIGFIFATKEDVRKAYSLKRVSQKAIRRAKECLQAEVALYADYVMNICYSYVISKDGEWKDSCGGFLGTDEDAHALAEAKSVVDVMTIPIQLPLPEEVGA